jgi:hypothetical protein
MIVSITNESRSILIRSRRRRQQTAPSLLQEQQQQHCLLPMELVRAPTAVPPSATPKEAANERSEQESHDIFWRFAKTK